ncbi:MAG: WecB/TagA/CpsF family glycosyltransferase [Spirochaetes bacterium]|nr:WecB/TagA/CpsF family glycosyltransferase [Spirochaetota bacterium]
MKNNEIMYDSYKEDRDIILEYNQADLNDTGVCNILRMGVDNLTFVQAVAKIIKMINDGGVHHVIMLNPYKLLRYRSNNDLNMIYSKASMKIATGSGMLEAAKRLHNPLKERIPQMSFIMEIIRLSEIKEYTIFLVGGKPETAEKAFFNIKKSFPGIRIVGRHGGFFSKEREASVVEAIRKSEANIVLVGMGFPREDKWISKFRGQFKNTVFIGIGGGIDIISGETNKAPGYFMESGKDWHYRIVTRPWRWGKLIRLFFFNVHLFFAGLFSKNKKKKSKRR